jgi:phosphonate transport system ATP-binding protein
VGMAAGEVVFDGASATLTDAVARELYGIASDGAGHADTAVTADIGFPAGAVGQAAD